MKSWLPCLASMLCASVALGEPPAPPPPTTQYPVSALIDEQLLAPLRRAESKRSRFSRAAPVALERRVRVLDAVALRDIRGRAFIRFAIDVRRAGNEHGAWQKDNLVGCAYPSEREVFVRRGKAYLPAANALGEDERAQPDACRAAPGGAVQVASAGR